VRASVLLLVSVASVSVFLLVLFRKRLVDLVRWVPLVFVFVDVSGTLLALAALSSPGASAALVSSSLFVVVSVGRSRHHRRPPVSRIIPRALRSLSISGGAPLLIDEGARAFSASSRSDRGPMRAALEGIVAHGMMNHPMTGESL
jgi:hypothetical protein